MALETRTLPPRYADPQPIGRGGMGDLYAAEDTELDRTVVVKMLSERFAGDEDVRERFKREALTAARLSGHPHIVTIFDVGEWHERPFIVMELLAGGTLAERMEAGRVSHAQALSWLGQAAEALDAAHGEGIVHRDVKPANLLFDERLHPDGGGTDRRAEAEAAQAARSWPCAQARQAQGREEASCAAGASSACSSSAARHERDRPDRHDHDRQRHHGHHPDRYHVEEREIVDRAPREGREGVRPLEGGRGLVPD